MGVSCVFPGFIRDAGMFADSGAKLPPGVGTRSPEDVARAVVDAIERNRGEVDVASLAQRGGAVLAGLAPDLAASVARRLGGVGIAERDGARACATSAEQRADPRAARRSLRRGAPGAGEIVTARSWAAASDAWGSCGLKLPRGPPRRTMPRQALAFLLRRVGAAAVQLLVALHEVGALRRSQSMKTCRTSPRRCSATPPMLVAPASVASSSSGSIWCGRR